MDNYSIYTLSCPKSGFIKYVGISNNPLRRYYEHLCYRYDSNKHKLNWINSVKSKGLKPKMDILESGISIESALKKEVMYISMFKSVGYNLVNICKGGKIAPSRLGIKNTEETTRKQIEASPLKKCVIQSTKNGDFVAEYIGSREACRITGIDHRSISQVASGSKIRKSAGGFIWTYKRK